MIEEVEHQLCVGFLDSFDAGCGGYGVGNGMGVGRWRGHGYASGGASMWDDVGVTGMWCREDASGGTNIGVGARADGWAGHRDASGDTSIEVGMGGGALFCCYGCWEEIGKHRRRAQVRSHCRRGLLGFSP